MGYELRTKVVEQKRNTFTHVSERIGDRPASRYQEATLNIQPMEHFHYRPFWEADHELYDPDYTILKLADPYSYADPRQFYYTPYVAEAADRHEFFGKTLKYIEDRRLLDRLPENFRMLLTDFVVPLRHYEAGAQLISVNACRFAHGTSLSQPAIFAAFDRIGNAQMLTLVGLTMAGGAHDTVGEAKKNWLYATHLQPLRRLVEELLVENDWAVGLLALELADSQLYPLLYGHMADRALDHGASAYSQIARVFDDWYAKQQKKWLWALIKRWSEDPSFGESNRKALGQIADRWFPPVCAAVRAIAEAARDEAGSTTAVPAAERVGFQNSATGSDLGFYAARSYSLMRPARTR
jgi:phenol/toluene 2-monooxygenase (NADH) P1/A1